jgi:hypothetical protein
MKVIFFGALILAIGTVNAAPFGGEADVKYAKSLWTSMTNASYAGRDSIKSRPYTGQHPHGAILGTIVAPIHIDGKIHRLIIKRNYGGLGVSKETVVNDPEKYLKAITVMLKRPGYDPETKDWFWVKYKADGSIVKNPAGMMLAGKVAKGKPMGCIAYHTATPGGDMVFTSD